jgi:hypothetical protein
MTTRTPTMRCRRLFLTGVLAIGAPFGTRQIQAFQCQNYHHAVPIAAVVLSAIQRHNTMMRMMMCETREQRSCRRRRPAIMLLRMTQESSPPAPLPRLFQEMIPPTTTTTTTTTSTTRATPLFQDQSKKPLVRVDNNTVRTGIIDDDESIGERRNDDQMFPFAVGDTVRVVVPDLRGYQIPAKGRGRYEPTATASTTNHQQLVFVPDPSLPYLILPIGLQGIVEKVFDNSVLSANLPIRVSFITADNDDDDNHDDNSDTTPQPPVNFQMHFAVSELALVHKKVAQQTRAS